jgi:hypothetical protein
MNRLVGGLDDVLLRLASRKHRLIGLALLRIVIGLGTVLFCLADYGNRQFLWGPTSFHSPQVARDFLPRAGFSLFLWSDSQLWFELLFHTVIVVSLVFMVMGGRALTVLQGVLMWSLHYRNQDVLEGGDNLVQILVIFMAFCVTNAYFAPGASRRRERMSADGPRLGTVVHNLAAFLVVFQTCVLYFAAGYWKITGQMWQNGVAMYYISRINGFAMSSTVAHLMDNAFLGTGICYFTVVIELAFPFAVLSNRAWLRKANILAIESMHAGIMAFMGLVCFGLLMIGADSVCLRDDDYLSLHAWARRTGREVLARLRPLRPATAAATGTAARVPVLVGNERPGSADA